MTNHAVDKQSARLEKDLNFNYSVVPRLRTSAQFPPYSTALREQPLAVTSQDFSCRRTAIHDPTSCTAHALQSPLVRGPVSYFTGIPVNLISRLRSPRLGCEPKHSGHTAFPRVAHNGFLLAGKGAGLLVLQQKDQRCSSTSVWRKGKLHVCAWEGYDGAKEEETNKISGTPAILEGNDFSKSVLIKENVWGGLEASTSTSLKH